MSLFVKLFTFGSDTVVTCHSRSSIFIHLCLDFAVIHAHSFSATSPAAEVWRITEFVSWLSTVVNFARFANWCPHDSWKHHDWLHLNLHNIVHKVCGVLRHILVHHHGLLLNIGSWLQNVNSTLAFYFGSN